MGFSDSLALSLFERAIEAGECAAPAPLACSFAAILERYGREVSLTKRGARWEKIRLNQIANYEVEEIGKLGDLDLARVTTEALGKWRDQRLREVQAASVLRDITLLASVFETARREWKLIAVNPIRDLRKPPNPPPRDRLPSEEEIERICLALGYDSALPVQNKSQQIAVAFLLATETAMRAGELLSLSWDQVQLGRRIARLEKTKNGDKRDVPLSRRAVELFESLRRIDPHHCFTVDPATRDALFRRARRDAGIENLHFHDSRALALTRLSKKLDVLELARTVGHRDPKSLMVYYRESAEEIAKKLD